MQAQGRWDDAAARLVECARALEGAGADFVMLCTNTMHKLAGHGLDVLVPDAEDRTLVHRVIYDEL